jgi:hypothetical protein
MKTQISQFVLGAAALGFLLGSVALGSGAESGTSNGGANPIEPKTPVGTHFGSALLWAAINADGTVARSDGANTNSTATKKFLTGSYQVSFFRNVTGCVYVATIGNAGIGNPLHGSIVVAARFQVPNAVFVETRTTPTGALADRPFHLFVNC